MRASIPPHRCPEGAADREVGIAMGVVLEVLEGPRAGLEYRAEERTTVTIGRSKTCDFHVLDTSMSRVHAIVACDEEGWYVEDAKSRNGVWLGEQRVVRHRLQDGDVFRVGTSTTIRFRASEGAVRPRTGEVVVALRCARCQGEVAESDLVRSASGRPLHLACRDLDHLVGTELGEFRIAERIAPLGQGFYFRAHQPALSRSVVLAVFDAPLIAQPGYREALLAEVRRASRFVHPHVLQILDFGESRGMCHVVMEHFAGRPVAEVLTERRFVRIRGAVQVAAGAIQALRHIVTLAEPPRWLAPSRLLVSEEHESKLWLFEDPDRRDSLPTAAEAPYVAPEISGEPGARGSEPALVYSAAALLYHMLAGIPPFEGDTAAEVARRSRVERPPALRRINLKVSPALAGAVESGLHREPGERPGTLAMFERQLQRSLGGR